MTALGDGVASSAGRERLKTLAANDNRPATPLAAVRRLPTLKNGAASPRLDHLLGTNGPLAAQLPGFAHRPEQVALAHAVESALAQGRPCLAEAGTGVGKCLAPSTPVLLFEGTIKRADEVEVGDLLMGPDSTPRRVLSLCRGREAMYQIVPIKGDPYTVNESHILSLKITKGAVPRRNYAPGSVVNIAVRDYLKQSEKFKHCAKGYRAGVDFAPRPVDINPYFLGLWLGDGNTDTPGITTTDPEVVSFLQFYACSLGLRLRKTVNPNRCPCYYLTTGGTGKVANRWYRNPLTALLASAGVLGDKHIPLTYKANSRAVRLQVLAGLIDSDGSLANKCYALILKVKRLAEDAVFLARSLGFAAYIRECQKTCNNTGHTGTYWRVVISGDTNQIPVRIARRKAAPRQQKKDVLLTGIKVEPVGEGEYCGFVLDGDHLFLLGDFTVTHNTLAYLVPLVRWLERHGGTAVVSTHTLALQAQLIERDIPVLLGALPELDIRAAALKGRSNFLCLQDMDTAAGELWTVGDPQFAQIRRWANESETGDVAELDFSFADWSEIAANADTCRQRECRYFERCFYFKARNRADECNLLVVNHALFFADLRLRRANPAGPHLLPKYDAVVFDEAHHVEDMATRAFGLEFGSRRVSQLVSRARRVPGGVIDPARLASLEALNQIVFEPFLSAPNPEAFINELVREDRDRQTFAARAADLCAGLNALAKDLAAAAENANDTALRDRTAGLARTATRLSTELRSITRLDEKEEPDDEPDYFRWYQTRRGRSGQAFSTLIQTPLDVAGTLQNVLLADVPRVVFASATLASGRSFAYLKSRLGLDDTDTVEAPVEIIEGSPFDFDKNALLYVPRHLGAPTYGEGQTSYTDRVADEVIALVEASRGRAFCLFTSHRMLQAVRERLWDRTDYPLFVQGDMPNARLVDAFKASGNGVLLGTASFWEGVDVPGDALSLVILDKLPFAAPDSPAQRARENAIKEQGGDAFRQFSLPQAQLRLKQGFGRLLRTTSDRGVVAVLDGRLWTKNYGRDFFADLPPCPRTDRIEDVERFFAVTAASPQKEMA